MERTLQITFTPEIIRRATRRWWVRYAGRFDLIFMPILTVLVVVYIVLSGDRGWLTGAVGTVVLLFWLVIAAAYIVTLNRGMAKFRAMGDPVATYRFSKSGIGTASGIGSMDLPWSAIEEIWTFEDVWLLFVAKNSYFTLPIADLDAGLRDFILEQVKAAGGRVR